VELGYKDFDKIFAALIGGIISFVVTTSIEKRKYKRQQQKENLNNILIPFCTSIEDTIKNFEKNEEKQIYLKNNLEEWKVPLEYLIASKRVFLTKQLKKLLAEYEDLLKKFEGNLEKEYKDFLIRYRKYMEDELMKYDSCFNIYTSLNKRSELIIKTLIIYKKYFSIKDNIEKIEFVYNDDPEKYKSNRFNFTDKNMEFYGAVNYSILDINDAIDDEQKETYYLLDYLYGIKNEKEIVMEIIKNYSSDKLLNEIKKLLISIRRVSLKEIDRIT
jgi:hypothetical protein